MTWDQQGDRVCAASSTNGPGCSRSPKSHGEFSVAHCLPCGDCLNLLPNGLLKFCSGSRERRTLKILSRGCVDDRGCPIAGKKCFQWFFGSRGRLKKLDCIDCRIVKFHKHPPNGAPEHFSQSSGLVVHALSYMWLTFGPINEESKTIQTDQHRAAFVPDDTDRKW